MFARVFRWLETRIDPFPAEAAGRPPADFRGFVLHYTWPLRWLIVATSALAAAVALIEVSLFAFLGRLVDWLQTTDPKTVWTEHGLFFAGMGAVVLIIIPFLKFWYEALLHQGIMGNFAMRTRWMMHRYVLRQSMEFFNNDFAGRVSTKVMQTALAVREMVMKVTEVFVYVGVYFTGALLMFAASDIRLTAPMLIWFVAYVAALRYFIPKLGAISTVQSDARSIMTGRIVDTYTNMATVKMFAHADREDAYAKDGMSPFLDTVHQQMRLVTLLTLTLNTLNCALVFSITGMAVWLWSIGAVTTGAIAFAIGLVLRMQGMAHWIMWEVASLFEQIGIIHDGLVTISQDRKVVDAPDAKPLSVPKGEIRYEDIRFNYGRNPVSKRGHIIDQLTLRIAPGEKVGLVGRSGAGKSTLVNLLMRFWDLDGGRILIDGQDISKVTQDSLRAAIGMVTQDTSLLHRSVVENILYGRPDGGAEAAMAAAKKAHAHDFIVGLQDLSGRTGYDAHVGERGVKLSGGQRQRVAIARVLLKDAPILILDEATSALDSEVEQAIQEQLYNLMEGKTVIAIAHRLSTIAAMDRLIVMDQGAIVEEGSHGELLKRGGLYADLWSRQSGGFLAREAAE